MKAEKLQAVQQAVQPGFLTDEQAAAFCGFSHKHWYNLQRAGKIGPEPCKFGWSVRWSRAELEAWAAAGGPNRTKWQAMKTARSA